MEEEEGYIWRRPPRAPPSPLASRPFSRTIAYYATSVAGSALAWCLRDKVCTVATQDTVHTVHTIASSAPSFVWKSQDLGYCTQTIGLRRCQLWGSILPFPCANARIWIWNTRQNPIPFFDSGEMHGIRFRHALW